MTRVAAILVNIVAYHHARWEAFAQSAGVECEVVEFTRRDVFRVLEFAAGATYRRITLFSNGTKEAIPGKAVNGAMAAALDEFRPEVVCISGYAFRVSLAALQWAMRRRVPVVVLSESNEFDEPRSAPKEFLKRRVVGLCSAGLAGGTPQAGYLTKLGLPADHVFVGYDVVDNDYFQGKAETLKAEGQRTEDGGRGTEDGSQRLEVRKKHGLPEKYFLACCRFGEKKNIPRLLRAYARYRAKAETLKAEKLKSEGQRTEDGGRRTERPWDLVLVGDGEKRAEIEQTISRLGIGGSVHLAGAKSYGDIPAYYALAGAFVHASTTEQWGLVVNEAMASGLPVLVSNRCGCAPDLIREGVNGFTFDPLDVEQLAQLMSKISAFEPFSLSAFGAESQRIISQWGPARFANGLQQAVECALRVGPVKPTLLQRAILAGLLRR
jgi:glycosyltransferase involved in cell wall biosynthesis